MAQFERVTYQRVFNLGNYESVRIGADVLINLGEDAKQALNEAKEFVEQWRKENNAYHFADTTPDIPIIPKKAEIGSAEININGRPVMEKEVKNLTQTERSILAINSFTQIYGANGLESFKLLVKGKPELQQAYDNKLKELQ